MDNFEDYIYIGNLYDFYGALLSDKQREVIKYYYNDDLSLSEISYILNISKQAVSNSIKRAESKLISFEKELKLLSKFEDNKLAHKKILLCISKIKESNSNKFIDEYLDEIIKISSAYYEEGEY